MKQSWLPTGSSDPLSYTCSCPASKSGDGLVLLFYRYFSAPPSLSSEHYGLANDPSQQASFHTVLTQKLNLGGKIRVAQEGFNITVGGTKSDIEIYMKECSSHWSFSGLEISTPEKRNTFFKPTSGGCACVFGGSPASVRVTGEITPMGVTNYIPKVWDEIESLSPAEFHARCHTHPQTVLLDVRNYYESRIGYFVDPKTGEAALRPPIRRFSQWPQYVKRYMSGSQQTEDQVGGREILTYCTGGIRCEKGARWMQENMDKREGDRVCTLRGGIAAYMTWIDEEIRVGRKRPEDSLFKGKNYVFDARGSTVLSGGALTDPVSSCHVCGKPADRLSKCRSKGCHLILVVCEACEVTEPRCCESCHGPDALPGRPSSDTDKNVPRPICDCERAREALLWGLDRSKEAKRRGDKTKNGDVINIRVRTID